MGYTFQLKLYFNAKIHLFWNMQIFLCFFDCVAEGGGRRSERLREPPEEGRSGAGAVRERARHPPTGAKPTKGGGYLIFSRRPERIAPGQRAKRAKGGRGAKRRGGQGRRPTRGAERTTTEAGTHDKGSDKIQTSARAARKEHPTEEGATTEPHQAYEWRPSPTTPP